MKRIFICLLLILCFTSCNEIKNEKQFLVVATGSMTGVYYPIGGSICRSVMQDYKGQEKIICSVSSTTGSIYNLNSMRSGNMDVSIAQSDWEYNAYTSLNTFSHMPPMENLRLLANLHKEYLTILTRKDANIKLIKDLKGKRVNIGAPGTGVRGAMLKLMEINGWDKNDFSVVSELKSSEQAQALCDNKIDVMVDFIGHPNASMQEATVACDSVFINIDDEIRKKLHDKYPYYENGTIPGNIYTGNEKDTQTISVSALLVTTSSLSDDLAYKITKSIVKHFDDIKSLSGALKDLQKKDMVKISAAPLHNGAKRYYKEIGLLN